MFASKIRSVRDDKASIDLSVKLWLKIQDIQWMWEGFCHIILSLKVRIREKKPDTSNCGWMPLKKAKPEHSSSQSWGIHLPWVFFFLSRSRVITEVAPNILVLSVSIVVLKLPNCVLWNVLFNKHEYNSDIRSPFDQFGNCRESALLTPASHNSLRCHYRWHFTFFFCQILLESIHGWISFIYSWIENVLGTR